MTIVRVFSIIGIKFAEKDFIDKAIEIKLLDKEEYEEVVDDGLSEIIHHIKTEKMDQDLSVKIVTHDITEKDGKEEIVDGKEEIVVGKIIGTKLVNGSYNSENEDVNPFYNLNELTKLFEETISLLKKSGFTFDKNDIRLFNITDDCLCCS